MTNEEKLGATARAMVVAGKGILAVDETTPTCTKRFAEFGIESTEDSRRAYRELLLTTPGIEDYISGVIMFDETIRQSAADGRRIVDVLIDVGVLPGIKVDTGPGPLANAPGETVTEGLDRLAERLDEYREIGARFTKWRAVIRIGREIPSRYCIERNAHALGRYASLVQEAGLVPIVEPEVLMNGEHEIQRCREVTEEVLYSLFDQLTSQRCFLEGIILKPNMITSGKECPIQADSREIADHTLQALRHCVPATVPGIAFLSGGQTGEEACQNLNEMTGNGMLPWELTFSFGRALQYPALQVWDGKAGNVRAAQSAFLHRARMSSMARAGTYSPSAERVSV